jgi:hypothetical protein
VLLAYRLPGGAPAERFRLRGLVPDATYRVTREGGGGPAERATGAALAREGVRVALDAEWRAMVVEIEREGE